MARRIRYVPDHESFGRFMLSHQMRSVTADVAGAIAKRAAVLAPVGASDEGVHMADEFHVNPDAGVLTVSGNVRVKVEVFNSNPAAAPNEFGGKRNRRHRMLGRAGAEHGDFKPDGGTTR